MCNAGPELGTRFLCSMMKRLPAVSAVVALNASELKPREWRCPERSWPAATGWSAARGGRGSLGYEVVQGCGGGNGREGLEE